MIEDKAWSFLTALTLSHIDRFITRITGYHISKWVHKSTNWHFGICAYRALFSKVSRLITFFLALQFFHLMSVFNHVHEGSIFRNQEVLEYKLFNKTIFENIFVFCISPLHFFIPLEPYPGWIMIGNLNKFSPRESSDNLHRIKVLEGISHHWISSIDKKLPKTVILRVLINSLHNILTSNSVCRHSMKLIVLKG